MIPFTFILAQESGFGAFIAFFTKGGFFMIPLVLCSLVSVMIIILRATALRRVHVLPEILEAEIERLSPGAPLDRISRIVGGHTSTLARVCETALQHRKYSRSEALEAVQTRARHEIVRLESGLVVLEVIIGIAPLLGLLGTVSGLVAVFANLGSGAAETDPRGIALGISEALFTTIAGLAIAIPSLIAFSYFSKKIETMAVEMESLVADLLAKIYHEPDGSEMLSTSYSTAENSNLSRRAGFADGRKRSALREPNSRKFEPSEPQLKRPASQAEEKISADTSQDELPLDDGDAENSTTGTR